MSGQAYPVKELITQAVVAALEEITLLNGYETDGVTVVRPRRTGERFTPQANGIAVLQADESRDAESDFPGNPGATAWRLPISCDLVVRLSETDARPMDQVLNLFEADVRRALAVDPQFGGLAIDSDLGDSEYSSPSDGMEGLTVWLHVQYRTDAKDPYTSR